MPSGALAKGPYNITITYLATIGSAVLTHDAVFNVTAIGAPTPGTASTAVQLATRAGGTTPFQTGANDLWNLLRNAFSATGITATSMVLTRYDGPLVGDVFISAATITNPGGVVGTPPIAGHQVTLTFRTGLGRVMKVLWVEDVAAGKARTSLIPNNVGDAQQRMAAYILSGTCVAHGRGGAFAVAPMANSHTYNEVVERRRFRQS